MSTLTFGIAKSTKIAPIIHQDPTTKKGSKNPPTWYKADPKAGPAEEKKANKKFVHYVLLTPHP